MESIKYIDRILNEETKKHTDAEVKTMMDYLAWKLRVSSFEKDFKNKVSEYLTKNSDADKNYVRAMADDLWKSYQKRGMIETYQEYISGIHIGY